MLHIELFGILIIFLLLNTTPTDFSGWLFHTSYSKLCKPVHSAVRREGPCLLCLNSDPAMSLSLPIFLCLTLSPSLIQLDYTLEGNIINHTDLSHCSLLIQCHKCNISLCHLKKQALQHCQCPPRNPERAILVWAELSGKKSIFCKTFHFPTQVIVVLHSFNTPHFLWLIWRSISCLLPER